MRGPDHTHSLGLAALPLYTVCTHTDHTMVCTGCLGSRQEVSSLQIPQGHFRCRPLEQKAMVLVLLL